MKFDGLHQEVKKQLHEHSQMAYQLADNLASAISKFALLHDELSHFTPAKRWHEFDAEYSSHRPDEFPPKRPLADPLMKTDIVPRAVQKGECFERWQVH